MTSSPSEPSSPANSPDLAIDPILVAPPLYRRMACWLYEGVLLFGVVFIADYLFSTLTQTRHGLENRHAQQAYLFVVLGIYFGWFWSRGYTLAMKTWHIRIVDTKGQPLPQWRAVWRYVLSYVWFLPPLAASGIFDFTPGELAVVSIGWIVVWALLSRFNRGQQFIHDLLAGTRLIHHKPEKLTKGLGV